MGVHKSLFAYNIQRPYPLRWFTPLVIFGGILATVLFSLVNISSGYSLVAVFTSNPDEVLQRNWYGSLPHILAKIKPTCQPAEIQLNEQLLTNNSALTYTLTRIAPQYGTENETESVALTYQNAIFENCSVYDINLILTSTERGPTQLALSIFGLEARAEIVCSFRDDAGNVTVANLSTSYDLVPTTVGVTTGFTQFQGRNKVSRASLFWGESLLAAAWMNTTSAMADHRFNGTPNTSTPWAKGFVSLGRNESIDDVQSPDYFSLRYRFIWMTDNGDVGVGWHLGAHPAVDLASYQPSIWGQADSFGKVWEATILTDLGQAKTPSSKILTDPKLLQSFSAGIQTAVSNASCCTFDGYYTTLGLADTDYQTWSSTNGTGPLGIAPSVISTSYLCQAPQQKPLGDLILSVLLADLVFLQALWMLFKLAVGWWMGRRYEDVNYCEACQASDGFVKTMGNNEVGAPHVAIYKVPYKF
ncbi:hypothetical protein NKR23_g4358 [Pleurostoma richardsiae]|uniref:Uncharacterized protein n=1 Tax=Pleurostoma richardsiae TaxID=41990 RepID=A0AA38VS87_9PEZI|nr:hypothetical protein NKR23_g4358 [Pleurostoma richardsiae]